MSPLRRATRAITESPLRALLAAASLAVAALVVAGPLLASRYPPMTDLPFHAAHTSILRHYGDPTWHFREQFDLQPIAVPYLSHYAIGALLMWVMPPLAAVKAATVIVLAMVPAGMAVLLHGMKRSPLGALLTLPLVYSTLTHWGFINFVGALGLFAMAVGLAMLVVDRPTPVRRWGLGITLVVLFFTHIFRFPMAIAAVVGTALFLYPATRRLRPVVGPMVPSLVLFGIWLVVRPKAIDPGGAKLGFEWGRRAEIWGLLFSGFADPAEKELAGAFVKVAAFTGLASLFAIFAEGRWPARTRRASLFAIGAAGVVVACTVVFLGLFFTLPMEIGVWWYVYPREATAAAFLAVAVLPGLPRSLAAKAPLVTAIAIAGLSYGRFVTRGYASFDAQTADFDRIVEKIPQAPKLLYLVFDHSGSSRDNTPFIHLPAYVQAYRGGWLSFHFAGWGASPMVYRDPKEPGAVVPPPVPLRWEWTPHVFRVEKHGAFFDWFLVRATNSPDAVFRGDPSIQRVGHEGKWWLYTRARR